jgi:hypothetical protein
MTDDFSCVTPDGLNHAARRIMPMDHTAAGHG